MGLRYIVAMHEPINDSDGDPSLLLIGNDDNGRWFDMYCDRPDCRWGRDYGFAFAVSEEWGPRLGKPRCFVEFEISGKRYRGEIDGSEAFITDISLAVRNGRDPVEALRFLADAGFRASSEALAHPSVHHYHDRMAAIGPDIPLA